MRGFLLDTNFISELRKPAPEKKVLQWLDSVNENALHLSVLTLGELSKGITLMPKSKRQQQLLDWYQLDLQLRFAGRLLPIDVRIAEKWGIMAANGFLNGKPLSVIDGLIAATAVTHDLILVTRNAKDFRDHIKDLFNPWD
ncbi:MAG: type II toxin-antitoxin system VapC family toxin [Candidatus Obscuribacterales bacterium]|jgi:predicted nucleic acid-binding protein|nr:type II toxin-antitoxin system VapC family toxin [Candidatus Obscuribacterales bacterium]